MAGNRQRARAGNLPDVAFETVKCAALKPAPYNPRKIGKEERSALEASISEFGLVQPLVANRRTMHVVGGHQRLRLRLERGVETVQVAWVDLDDARERALNVVLNSKGARGEFTDDVASVINEIMEATPELISSLNLGFLAVDDDGSDEEIQIREWVDAETKVDAFWSFRAPIGIASEIRHVITSRWPDVVWNERVDVSADGRT